MSSGVLFNSLYGLFGAGKCAEYGATSDPLLPDPEKISAA
jgi:hypothetical protein